MNKDKGFMIRLRRGKVKKIIEKREGMEEVLVEVEGIMQKAINYVQMTGPVNIEDEVVLNTTALFLNLGSGGYNFIIYNFSNSHLDIGQKGHIMKLRYTPLQVKCLSVEEKGSSLREKIENTTSLEGMPVVIVPLHSAIAAVCASIKYLNDNVNIAYIMTDGGALPIFFSKTVYVLKKLKLLDLTITVGHAFGGDLEAITLYSGLIAAKAAGCHIVIVGVGPGIVGTETKYGNTGIIQGEAVNAVNVLKGKAIVVPRIMLNDKRERHYLVSHHTLTALSEIALTKAFVVLSEEIDVKTRELILKRFNEYKILEKHEVIFREGKKGIEYLRGINFNLVTMGKDYEQESYYFLTAAAGGVFAAENIIY
ncbi:MAG: DUF3866 family protein [Thermovenabulum sp.]|uniref:DUF3866 family protein n=1 Tax=Thermovenabulum sp. TaxID=3100335 RepID=UPI003C7BC0FD